MTARMILHNMIIENVHGHNNLDCNVFDLMGHRVWPIKNPNRIEHLLQVYHPIRDVDTHVDLLKDLMEERWS